MYYVICINIHAHTNVHKISEGASVSHVDKSIEIHGIVVFLLYADFQIVFGVYRLLSM